jgi:hypothetical protein
MNRSRHVFLATLAVLLCTYGLAQAAPVVLKFEGIAPYPHSSTSVFIQNYYNGGAASNGNVGPNYGVTFDADALLICLNTPGVTCSNTSRGGLGDPASHLGALFFLTGNDIAMDVAGGFDTGFSFNYVAINQPGAVRVYSGAGGTGTELASFALPITLSACGPGFNAGFCPFYPVGVSFGGTAMSVVFAGVGNQIVFDDITFGSATPGNPVPEPASMLLFSTGLVGLRAWRKRRG